MKMDNKIIEWLNSLKLCQSITDLKELADGKFFSILTEIISERSQQIKVEELIDNETVALELRYNAIENALSNFYKMNMKEVINFNLLMENADFNEIVKTTVLLLTAITYFNLDSLNNSFLTPLYNLDSSIQAFIKECLEMVLFVENEIQLGECVSSIADKRRIHQNLSSRRKSRQDELILRQYFSSADLKYKLNLKAKKKEIIYLRETLLNKDVQIKELNERIDQLKPYKDLVELNEPDKLKFQEKVAFLESKYKNCDSCSNYEKKIQELQEEIKRLKESDENKFLSAEKELQKSKLKITKLQEKIKAKEEEYQKMQSKYSNMQFQLMLSKKQLEEDKSLNSSNVKAEPKKQSKEIISKENQENLALKEKIKTEKVSPKLLDKNLVKIKELQKKNSELNCEVKKKAKECKSLTEHLDSLTNLYGSQTTTHQETLQYVDKLNLEIRRLQEFLAIPEGSKTMKSFEMFVVASLEKTINKLSEDISHLKEQLAEKQLTEKENEVSRSKVGLHENEIEIKQTSKRRRSGKSENIELVAIQKPDSLLETNNHLLAKISGLQEKLESSEKQLQEKRNEISKLKSKLDKTEKEIEHTNKRRRSRRSDNMENFELHNFESLQKTTSEQFAEISQLKEMLQDSKNQLDKKENEILNLKKEIEKLKNCLEIDQKQLRNRKSDKMENIKIQKSESLQKSFDEQQTKISQLEEKLKSNENLLNAKENEIFSLNKEIEPLKCDVLKLNKEMEQWKCRHTNLNSEYRNLQEKYQKLLVEKETDVKDMEMKTSILKENYDHIKREKEEADIKLSHIENNHKELITKLDLLRKTLSKKEAEINDWQTKHDRLISEYDQIQRRLQESEENNQILENERANEFRHLQETLSERNGELKHLQSKLAKETEELTQQMIKKKDIEDKFLLYEKEKECLILEVAKFQQEKSEDNKTILQLKQSINQKLSEIKDLKNKIIEKENIADQTIHQMTLQEEELKKKKQIIDELNEKMRVLKSDFQKVTSSHKEKNFIEKINQLETEKLKLLAKEKNHIEKVNHLESEKHKLSLKFEHLNQSFKERKEILYRNEDEIKTLKHERLKLQESLNAKSIELERVESKYRECQRELEYTGQQINDSKKKNERLNKEIIKIEGLLSEKNKTLKRLEDLFKETKAEIACKSQEINNLEQELERKDTALENMVQREALSINAARQEHFQEIEQLKEDLQNSENEVMKLRNQLQDKTVSEKENALTLSVTKLNEEKIELQKQLSDTISIKEEIISSLKQEIGNLNDAITSITKDNEELRKIQEQLIEEKKQLSSHLEQSISIQVEKVKEELKHAQEQVLIHENANKIKTKNIHNIKKTLLKTQKELMFLKHERKAKSSNISILTSTVSSLEEKIQELNKENSEIKIEKENLAGDIKLLNEETKQKLDKLVAEKKTADWEIQQLEYTLKEKSAEVKDLSNHIYDLVEKHKKEIEDLKDEHTEEIDNLTIKCQDLEHVHQLNESLKHDLRMQDSEIRHLAKTADELKKLEETNKLLLNVSKVQKQNILRLSRKVERMQNTIRTLRLENASIRKLLKRVKENPNVTEDLWVEYFAKVTKLEAESDSNKARMDYLNKYNKHLENLLDLEEEKNKKLFMRLKTTEYKFFQYKEEHETPIVSLKRSCRYRYPRIIYKESFCHHYKNEEEDKELVEGPPDPDMPGHCYLICKELKTFLEKGEPLFSENEHLAPPRRKEPYEEKEDGTLLEMMPDLQENYDPDRLGPSTVTIRYGVLPAPGCLSRTAYSVFKIPSASPRYSDGALEFGFAIEGQYPRKKAIKRKALKIKPERLLCESIPHKFFSRKKRRTSDNSSLLTGL